MTRRLAKTLVQSRLEKAPESRKKEDARQGRRKTIYFVFKSLYNKASDFDPLNDWVKLVLCSLL